MTYRVAKSQMFDGFEARVAAHAFEMKHWRGHMAQVAEDQKNDVEPMKRHVAHPRPASHPLVEACVNENDLADYEIVDDGPSAEQILDDQKEHLIGQISIAERDAIVAVVPAGKQRLFDIRELDIRQADSKIISELQKPGFVAAALAAVGIAKMIDFSIELPKRRPAEDTRFLGEQTARRERIVAIQRKAAQAHHDIEDLTADTIGAWVMPDLNS